MILPKDREERLRAIEGCDLARACGMVLTSLDEYEAVVEMDLEGKTNGFGTGHGGAVFALADQAFAVSANRGENAQVARSASIEYLRPARGRLRAIARVVEESETTSVHRVEVFSGEELVAVFEGRGHKLLPKARSNHGDGSSAP
jgi:acyl-CoA thioesterase